jgi:phosphoribosylaminoimidazole-succinocarboxamide synthase
MKSGEKLDKDRFRRDLGGEEEAYQEVARRLGLLQDDGEPGEVFDLSAHRTRLRGGMPKPKK